ncbi:MAG: class I SAM-dependent methyltransferase [Acidimicrobiaceae bacterium]|nr:class I SAM-dependent methyltransferase [Acidimicrobiaceae bacterium]
MTPPVSRWNHNIHYHPLILAALPPGCDRVLDVGCGEGLLARDLSTRVRHVVAMDKDAPTIALAREASSASNVDYVLGDVLQHPFEPESFDAVVSIATVHHIGAAPALSRMRQLLRPGGHLAVVGLARSRTPRDLAFDAAGAVGMVVYKRTKGWSEVRAPTVWPPPETYRQVRQTASSLLPGVHYRRHVLFRYSLVWTKPSP